MNPRVTLLVLLSGMVVCAVLAAPGIATAEDGKDLLRATVPGAYSIRYLPDRALVSSTTEQDVELRLHLPAPPLWSYLASEKQADGFAEWDAQTEMASIRLPAGSHELQLGWAGSGEQPAQGQTVELRVDGEKVGELVARFTLERMVAEGGLDLGVGTARAWLVPVEGARVSPLLRVGETEITEWEAADGRLWGKQTVGLGDQSRVRLVVEGYNLLTSPVARVGIEKAMSPVAVERVADMPRDGIVIEAEDFVAQGGGEVGISEGGHVDQHGGKSIFNYGGDGHWLEWEVEVPQEGHYDLYARVACAEERTFRKLTVDGEPPAGAFAMLQFPGTGGWARAAGEWWAVRVAGASDELPPLSLTAGKHRLRMEGVLQYHMNLDYMVLKKR